VRSCRRRKKEDPRSQEGSQGREEIAAGKNQQVRQTESVSVADQSRSVFVSVGEILWVARVLGKDLSFFTCPRLYLVSHSAERYLQLSKRVRLASLSRKSVTLFRYQPPVESRHPARHRKVCARAAKPESYQRLPGCRAEGLHVRRRRNAERRLCRESARESR
jgi:hypothetical protein